MDSYERSIELLRFCRSHHKLACTMMRRNGLTAGVPPILDYLHDHNGCIQNELSRNCHLEPATITSILTTMERDGLIERRADPGDRRVWRVYMTGVGAEADKTLRRTSARIAELCFEGFAPEEIDAALGILARITRNMHRAMDTESECCEEKKKNHD